MIKHLLNWFLFAGSLFAAGAAAVGGGNAGNESGSGTPPSGGGGPASGDAQPTAAPSGPSAQPGDQGLKQLREAYEGVKAKFEPYEKLNLKPEQITQHSGVYQKVFGEAQAIGRELGFPDDEIAEALNEDPLRTIEFLRNQVAMADESRQQPGQQELADYVQNQIDQAMGPIQHRENVRMTDTANSLFESTVRQLAVDSFKAEGLDVAQIPQDEMFMLTSATSEIMKYDNEALTALKFEGKTAAIQKAFQEARNYLDKYYLARAGREKNRLQPSPRPGQAVPVNNNTGKKPTLDELIENPGLIGPKYA